MVRAAQRSVWTKWRPTLQGGDHHLAALYSHETGFFACDFYEHRPTSSPATCLHVARAVTDHPAFVGVGIKLLASRQDQPGSRLPAVAILCVLGHHAQRMVRAVEEARQWHAEIREQVAESRLNCHQRGFEEETADTAQ